MARIRTIKPEFWEDEVVGLLSREARLLFIATFNLADDEGLLRWTAPYIKASAFMYDDDLSIVDITKCMHELSDAGLLFPYIGGVARQQMAMVVNFRRHQKINRPQPGKLPPPSLQNGEVRRMYARRDNWICGLCQNRIPERPVANDSFNLSIDHIVPQARGGSDYPTNLRATHQGCNKGRRDGLDEEFTVPLSMHGLQDALNDSVNDSVNESAVDSFTASHRDSPAEPTRCTERDIPSVNDAVNDSMTRSLPEGNREGNREQGTGNNTFGEPERESQAALVLYDPAATSSRDVEKPPRLDVEKACTLLADLIEANGSKRPTITQHWRDSARRMIDLDGVALEDVLGAIRWSQNNEFWRANILSMPKLRQKYDQLRLQANRGQLAPTGTSGATSHNAGVLQRRRARREGQQ